MADNYITSLLRPASQRRQRSAIIDPMESQAAMDRAQGVNVSNASDPSLGGGAGGSGILRMASSRGGGGGTPVRTAQMTDADEGDVQQTQYQIRSGGGGTCRPGMPCYRGPSQTVVSSAPMATTVTSSQPVITSERVISSRPVTASAPITTTVSAPQNYLPSPIIPSGDPASMAASAIPLAASFETMPQAGLTLAASKVGIAQQDVENDRAAIGISASEQQHNQNAYWAEFPLQQKNVESLIANRAADTANKLAEVDMTRTQTDLIGGSTIPGRNEQVSSALQQITAGNLSVQTFHDTMMRADSVAPMVMQDNGKTKAGATDAPASAMSDEARSQNYRRMGYSALALNVLFTNKHIANLDAPADETQVGVSPITEAALKQKRPSPLRPGYQDSAPDIHAVTDRAISMLVANYASSNTFERKWNDVDLMLADEVLGPLMRVNSVMATNGLKPGTDAYTRAYLDAKKDAQKYYDVIRLEVKNAYNEKWAGKSQDNQGSMSDNTYYGFGGTEQAAPSTPVPVGLSRLRHQYDNRAE